MLGGIQIATMSPAPDEDGPYIEETTLEDVLEVFDSIEGPVVTSADVADTLECSRQTARRKLTELYDQGWLGQRKTAGRVIYWKLDAAAPNPVNPDDPIFTDRPSFASGEENLSERVDELLYGKDG